MKRTAVITKSGSFYWIEEVEYRTIGTVGNKYLTESGWYHKDMIDGFTTAKEAKEVAKESGFRLSTWKQLNK